MDYGWLFLSWGFFGGLHSLTASLRFKAAVMQKTHLSPTQYRLVYNGLSVVSFAPILLALRQAPSEPLTSWAGSPAVSLPLLLTGIAFVVGAFRHYSLSEFLGIAAPIAQQPTLQQQGLLAWVRHPLYTGTLLILLGLLARQPDWKHLWFSLFGFLYIRIGIWFEERKLTQLFGDTYRNYQRQTPMLLPFYKQR